MSKPSGFYWKIVAVLVAAWFTLSLVGGATSWFQAPDSRPPLHLAVAAGLPIMVFLLWFASSAGFRQFALGLNPQLLTFVHTWRVIGLVFVVLAGYHLLPNVFAQPAGWGDFAIGLTAPFVALYLVRPDRRGSFLTWQFLGLLDLIVAIITGISARLLGQGAAMTPMVQLPLSLVPTFGVPLLAIVHMISIAQVWKSKARAFQHELAPAPLRSY